jgi:hypothetical protein
MSDKFYTNIILTVIAILLAGILLKGFVNPIETKVFAGDEKYKEFRAVTTVSYEVDKTIQESVKLGWKPISIAQSQMENRSYADLTIIFAK